VTAPWRPVNAVDALRLALRSLSRDTILDAVDAARAEGRNGRPGRRRLRICPGCKCVSTVGRSRMCGWPCSMFGYAPLLGRRRIVSRKRWLAYRGIYEPAIRPDSPADPAKTWSHRDSGE
jgi:hypothetical protein